MGTKMHVWLDNDLDGKVDIVVAVGEFLLSGSDKGCAKNEGVPPPNSSHIGTRATIGRSVKTSNGRKIARIARIWMKI